MNYSKEDVLTYINEEDVKFIKLQFCDYDGAIKSISVMPNQIKKAFEKGIMVDSKIIKGYEKYQNIIIIPDPDTICLLPWRPSQGRVIRMFCDIYDQNKNEINDYPRNILKKAEQENKDKSIKLTSEYPFYVFKMDDDGNNTYIPYDKATYLDVAPRDKCEDVRREICLSLYEMEIPTSGSHHDEGPGQNTINVLLDSPLKAADNITTFRSVVKTISARNGLYADFNYLPIKDVQPNEIKIIVQVDKENLVNYVNKLKANLSNLITINEYENEIIIHDVKNATNPYLIYASILNILNK